MTEKRTDLALEARESFPRNHVEIQGVVLEKKKCLQGKVKITTVIIRDEAGSKAMKKPKGTYITIESPLMLHGDIDEREPFLLCVCEQLESMIKGSYNKWKKKKIRCLHCKEEVFIKPNGFCPKCSVGTELPTKYFIEALVSFSSFTMEEYIHLCSHPMSDVSAIAKRELQKIWIAAPNKLEYVIDNFEKLEYDGCIFELILQLPSQITCPYGMALKRLGMEISEEMQLIWLGNLRSLEWISAECMKTMVCESLSDESDAIRNKAMKCWLGEKDFWWENFA